MLNCPTCQLLFIFLSPWLKYIFIFQNNVVLINGANFLPCFIYISCLLACFFGFLFLIITFASQYFCISLYKIEQFPSKSKISRKGACQFTIFFLGSYKRCWSSVKQSSLYFLSYNHTKIIELKSSKLWIYISKIVHCLLPIIIKLGICVLPWILTIGSPIN